MAGADIADAKMYKKVLSKFQGIYSEKSDTPIGSSVTELVTINPRVWLSFSIGGSLLAERVVIELWADKLPKTCENFRALTAGSIGVHPLTRRPMHYKGSQIHRVLPGLMIQGGDFVCGDGSCGESIYGAYFADEGFEAKHDAAGLLCMANSGRDTNNSQFYITTAPAPHLDGRHVVFGRVVEGMPTVAMIESVVVDSNGRPTTSNEIIIHDCGELVADCTRFLA